MLKPFLLLSTICCLTACGQTSPIKQNNLQADAVKLLATDQKMDTAYFWKILDYGFEKAGFDPVMREQAIVEQLVRLTPAQIQEFEIIFQQMNKKASTWNNLAAQTIIEGGSSDDGFYYFRCWLISLGQKHFYEILKNPDYIASLDVPSADQSGAVYTEFEELLYVADKAYGIVTKKDPLKDTSFPRDNALGLKLFYDTNVEITGVEWKNDDLPKLLPALYKKYGGQ